MGLKEEVIEMEEKVEEISFAYEMLKEERKQSNKQSKRQFIIILVLIGLLALAMTYIVFLLNDVGTIEETTTYEQEVSDIDNIGGNVINKGNIYGEDKTND